jgi:DNA gyrase/topoisomerase IV subunit A
MNEKFVEKFIDRNIGELALEQDCVHGYNVNAARITPNIIDGLKPVQRRAIYIMSLKDKGKSFRKLASISGDTFGKIHPHAPTSIDDAVVNMEQEWKNSIPLIDGEGNFGDISGSVAGASRYIKARLSDYCRECFFSDWDNAAVDMKLGADEETMEPLYLPAKYPNILVNGCLGIGYGMAANFPCFNFKEVIDACILLLINPKANVVLIPDSPTGCDIIETNFASICERGNGSYTMRCTYEINDKNNMIKITSLPYMVFSNDIRRKIAEVKEKGGLQELIKMDDLSGKKTEINLYLKNDVNPYKFIKKLIKNVSGFENGYPVNITVVNNLRNYDYSIKDVLLQWIEWRREQKRIIFIHKKSSLIAEQRANDVKLFIMNKKNLQTTIEIFRSSRNRAEIESRLIAKYKDSEIHMDSLQARALSNMRMIELSIESYEACVKRRDEIIEELDKLEKILATPNGIDKEIIAELRDGAKRFGVPRRSNVIPYEINTSNEISQTCILQLSSEGNIFRRVATNVDEEPIPTDSNGFAAKVEDDSSFVLIDENGYHAFIKVKDIPLDSEVPVNRYAKHNTTGNIVALLPINYDADICCVLISKKGQIKKLRVSDLTTTKKPYMALDEDDKIVRGIIVGTKSYNDILVYTKNGQGQRLDPNGLRITSPLAKGGNGFKLNADDEIIGCYKINPKENAYLCYVTMKGKFRLNAIQYLPVRDSKHDSMVKLISLNDRDKLISIIGCNKLDKVQVYYDDMSSEIIELDKLEESTMGSEPKKVTKKNAVSNNIIKAKLV